MEKRTLPQQYCADCTIAPVSQPGDYCDGCITDIMNYLGQAAHEEAYQCALDTLLLTEENYQYSRFLD